MRDRASVAPVVSVPAIGDVRTVVGAVQVLAVPAIRRADDSAQLVPHRTIFRYVHNRRIVAGDSGGAVAIEISTAGLLGLVVQHVEAKDEAQAARNFDAGRALPPAFRITDRAPLVIDADIVGANHLSLAVQHGGHPVGGAVEGAGAGASP